MSNDDQPLAKLIEQGLKEGTVLNIHHDGPEYVWRNNTLTFKDGRPLGFNPLQATITFRIVSTPPKKITFEAVVSGALGYKHTRVPDYAEFKAGDAVIVTVEEKR